MKTLCFAYLFTMLPMAVLDAVWLSWAMKRFYAPKLGHLLAQTPNWGAAVLFYFLYVAGAVALVVLPALKSETSLTGVAVMGVILGVIAYGTYDLTNQATLENWSWTVTVVDMIWGGILTGTASVVGVYLFRLFIASAH